MDKRDAGRMDRASKVLENTIKSYQYTDEDHDSSEWGLLQRMQKVRTGFQFRQGLYRSSIWPRKIN